MSFNYFKKILFTTTLIASISMSQLRAPYDGSGCADTTVCVAGIIFCCCLAAKYEEGAKSMARHSLHDSNPPSSQTMNSCIKKCDKQECWYNRGKRQCRNKTPSKIQQCKNGCKKNN